MTEQTSNEPCAAPGDSGGPLVCFEYDENNDFKGNYINGIVSKSEKTSPCISGNVWVDVRKFTEWITPLLVSTITYNFL